MQLINDFFSVVSHDDASCTTVRFNPRHVIYQAHFPGNPVTPGVCIIQMITELLQARLRTPLTLAEVKNIKFVVPISPDSTPQVTVVFTSVDTADGDCRARGVVTAGEVVYTKFSLRYHLPTPSL